MRLNGFLAKSNIAALSQAEIASYSRKPECAPLTSALAHPISVEASQCERIAFPENPSRSFIYGGTIYLLNRDVAKDVVARLLKKRKKSFSEDEKNQLTIELTRYMYNGGAGGIKQAFLSFMDEPGNAELDLASLKKAYSDYLTKNFGEGLSFFQTHADLKTQMRGTVPGYAGAVDEYAKGIGASVNAQCEQL